MQVLNVQNYTIMPSYNLNETDQEKKGGKCENTHEKRKENGLDLSYHHISSINLEPCVQTETLDMVERWRRSSLTGEWASRLSSTLPLSLGDDTGDDDDDKGD